MTPPPPTHTHTQGIKPGLHSHNSEVYSWVLQWLTVWIMPDWEWGDLEGGSTNTLYWICSNSDQVYPPAPPSFVSLFHFDCARTGLDSLGAGRWHHIFWNCSFLLTDTDSDLFALAVLNTLMHCWVMFTHMHRAVDTCTRLRPPPFTHLHAFSSCRERAVGVHGSNLSIDILTFTLQPCSAWSDEVIETQFLKICSPNLTSHCGLPLI